MIIDIFNINPFPVDSENRITNLYFETPNNDFTDNIAAIINELPSIYQKDTKPVIPSFINGYIESKYMKTEINSDYLAHEKWRNLSDETLVLARDLSAKSQNKSLIDSIEIYSYYND